MALRSLQRRIPGIVALRRARMGPLHGPPPAAAARFMGTQSQASRFREAINEEKMKLKLIMDYEEKMKMEEGLRSVRRAEIVAWVGTAVCAIPLFLVIAGTYQESSKEP